MRKHRGLFGLGMALCSIGQIMGIPTPTFAQNDAGGGSTSAQIKKIRKQYVDINAGATGYTKKQRDLSGFSAEGGTLVGYYRKDALKKIVATYYGESGRTIHEFYFANGALIFMLSTDLRYTGSLREAANGSGGIASTKHDRFYFAEGTLIRWLSPDGKNEPTQDRTGKQKEKELKADVVELRKRLFRPVAVSKATLHRHGKGIGRERSP